MAAIKKNRQASRIDGTEKTFQHRWQTVVHYVAANSCNRWVLVTEKRSAPHHLLVGPPTLPIRRRVEKLEELLSDTMHSPVFFFTTFLLFWRYCELKRRFLRPDTSFLLGNCTRVMTMSGCMHFFVHLPSWLGCVITYLGELALSNSPELQGCS